MIYILYTLLALLALDVLSTLIALSKPGNGLCEGNGIMAALFSRFGVIPSLLITHVALGVYLWFATAHMLTMPQQSQDLWAVVLVVLAVFYGRTDYSNFKLIKGAQ